MVIQAFCQLFAFFLDDFDSLFGVFILQMKNIGEIDLQFGSHLIDER